MVESSIIMELELVVWVNISVMLLACWVTFYKSITDSSVHGGTKRMHETLASFQLIGIGYRAFFTMCYERKVTMFPRRRAIQL